MDTDQKIDELVAFGYAGTTVMHSRMPSGTGSRLSESSVEGPPPFVDLMGGPMDRLEKPPDLDKMVMLTDASLAMPQVEKMPIKEALPSTDMKKKSKKKKKVKEGEVAGASTSMPKAA